METILAIRDLFTGKTNVKTSILDYQEIKDLVEAVRDWCKYDVTKITKVELGRGAFGTVYKACLTKNCDPPLVVRVINYDPDTKYPVSSRPENVEWKIHKELYKTLVKKNVYNITTPIFSFCCDTSNLLSKLKEKFVTDNSIRYLRFTFTDMANGGSLQEFLDKNQTITDEFILAIILQVLLTLCTIYKSHPNYRHNDLHIGNLLVSTKPSKEYYDLSYRINSNSYLMRSQFMILLNDFDYNSIYGTINNAKVADLMEDVEAIPSPYYDVHKFINSLLSLPKREILPRLSSPVRKFLESIVPPFIRGRSNRSIDFYQILNSERFEKDSLSHKFDSDEYTPNKIILDPIFTKVITTYSDSKVTVSKKRSLADMKRDVLQKLNKVI